MFCSNCGKEIDDQANFCQYCGGKIETKEDDQSNNFQQKNSSNGCAFVFTFFIVFIILFVIIQNIDAENTKMPRLPKDLECVQYKNLCIATTDVKYDYTAVQSVDRFHYKHNWNNGWASAQKACKSWGGRLPYLEDFPTILEAYFNGKIQLEQNRTYLTASEINWHRIYAFSNSWVVSRDKKYDKNNIYDYAISISKSADSSITGDYSTSDVYDWPARCVKTIK